MRVPLLLLDASGWPLVPDLAQQDTLRNGLKAAATPKGPAAAQAGTLQAVVESWQWPEAAGGADEGAQPPVIWVSVSRQATSHSSSRHVGWAPGMTAPSACRIATCNSRQRAWIRGCM